MTWTQAEKQRQRRIALMAAEFERLSADMDDDLDRLAMRVAQLRDVYPTTGQRERLRIIARELLRRADASLPGSTISPAPAPTTVPVRRSR